MGFEFGKNIPHKTFFDKPYGTENPMKIMWDLKTHIFLRNNSLGFLIIQ